LTSTASVTPALSGDHARLADYLDARVLDTNSPAACPGASGGLAYEHVADYLDGRVLEGSGAAASPPC
jgi:hypothetical protein